MAEVLHIDKQIVVVVHVTLPLLDYINRLKWTVACTSDQNDHNTKPMAYQNSEQVHETCIELVSNSYLHTLWQQIGGLSPIGNTKQNIQALVYISSYFQSIISMKVGI